MWIKFRRVVDTPGWLEIQAWVSEHEHSPQSDRVQCATLDGIPFVMKRADFENRYTEVGLP